MALASSTVARLRRRLTRLYPDRVESCLARIGQVAEKYAASLSDSSLSGSSRSRWDQKDLVLITYGDQVSSAGEATLQTLRRFLQQTGLDQWINTVHILPFCPSSSDDGFSIIDHRQIDPKLGDWDDMHDLGQNVELMFDFVLNHVSRESQWFQDYLQGNAPWNKFFLEVDPATDLSAVIRPRSLSLLRAVETSGGRRHVWTTFSEDQIDLNFAEPEVLIEMLDILLFYVQQGARIIRLDAIAYLWKKIGTACIHLPETHQTVKLMRDLLDALAPHVLLLTETNVPHTQNVSYFGEGDEAHMVYQFSLPPLLLDAFLSQDAGSLARWMTDLGSTRPGTTYFNFTASHDGIGLRPLEGLVSPERFDSLIEAVKARGGLVSTRHHLDGSESPYEINITYLDALGEPEGMNPTLHARRFLASQAIMLALRGIPGIYFHSLVGTTNDYDGVKQSGQTRRINRRKFDLDELIEAISTPGSVETLVFEGYRRLLALRSKEPAFHPDGEQQVLNSGEPSVLAFLRTSIDSLRRILVVANFSRKSQTLDLSRCSDLEWTRDLLSDETPQHGKLRHGELLDLEPFQVAWLEATT